MLLERRDSGPSGPLATRFVARLTPDIAIPDRECKILAAKSQNNLTLRASGMPTVTINAVDYDVYADLDTADEFLAADFSADAWRAETDVDQKARADVTATRLLDRIRWAGEKTDPDQLHAFPRTGITGLDEDTVPQPIIDASIVLAKLIHAGSSVDSQPSTQSATSAASRPEA
jgi:hypothetical protein